MKKAAMVAIEIVDTVATRTPAMIAGVASGNSTRQKVCLRVRPIPRADSSTSAGTLRKPVDDVADRGRTACTATSGIAIVITVEPGDRHEDREERDARQRVEEVA